MKVLLINPAANILENRRERKYAAHPLGLAYIAAILEREDVEVKIFDALIYDGFDNETVTRPGFIRYGVSKERVRKEIEDFGPDLVGILSLHSNRKYEIMEVTEAAKEVNPRIITVIGAGYPSAQPAECLSDPNCDYIVMGEGEETTVQLVRKLKSNDTDFSTLDGFGYKRDGKIIINPKCTVIRNLDALPFPAYHLLDMKEYTRIGTGMGRFETRHYTLFNATRGCPHTCHFCGKDPIIGKGYRKRSLRSVMEELWMLKTDYGIEEVHFVDFHALADRKYLHDFLRATIREKLSMNIAFPHGMAVASLDDDTLELLAQAGCDHLYMAIESANQIYVDTLNKGIKLHRLEHIIHKAHELEMTAGGYFVIGLPHETWNDIVATSKLPINLGLDDANFFIATPLPGSNIFKDCQEQDLIRSVFSTERIRYSLCNLKPTDYTPEMIEEIRYTAWLAVREQNKDRLQETYGKRSLSDRFYEVPEWRSGLADSNLAAV